MNKQDLRRLKTFAISKPLLVGLLSLNGTLKLKMEGMPEDAVILSVSDDLLPDSVVMEIWSSSFPVADPSKPLPRLEIKVSQGEP